MPVTTSYSPTETLPVRAFRMVFSFPMFIASIFACAIYLFIPQSMADPDIWWHLRNAQLQLQTHSFIRSDMYSFTAHGDPWMNHEWLAELPFYFGWHLLGARGLFFVTVIAIEIIMLGVLYLAYKKSGNIKAALLVAVIAGMLSTVSYGPRTLLFGWIFLILELIVLERASEEKHLLWSLPVLFMIWVNTHGSWLIGIALLLIFVICGSFPIRYGMVEGSACSPTQRRRLILVSGLSLAALFINPYGWRLVSYPFDLAYRQKLNIANVEEWFTLDFHSVRGRIMLVSLALLFLFQILKPRKWAPYELAFLFIGVYSSFSYSRFLFLAAILVLPLLARDIPGLPPYEPEKNKPWLNALILLGLMPFVIRHTPDNAHVLASGDRPFPDAALPYLQKFHPEGKVWNDYLWGGYLIWNVRHIPVFVDSRVDIFEYDGAFKDYLDATRLKNSLSILDKHKIRYVFFEKNTPFVYLLEHTPGWKIDYQDAVSVLLERTTTKP